MVIQPVTLKKKKGGGGGGGGGGGDQRRIPSSNAHDRASPSPCAGMSRTPDRP